MDFALRALVLFMMAMASLHVSMAHEYQVGDDKGWTFSVNYTTWSSSHNIVVNDILVFQYDPTIHNVVKVRELEYNSCTVTGKEPVFSTGLDYLKLITNGHYYFISNFTGNCEAGQRIAVRVTDPSKDKKSPPPQKLTPSLETISSLPPSPTEQLPMAPALAPDAKNIQFADGRLHRKFA